MRLFFVSDTVQDYSGQFVEAAHRAVENNGFGGIQFFQRIGQFGDRKLKFFA
jgi:hypothetical protein